MVWVEASPLEQGSELLFFGRTTGLLECMADEVYVNEAPAEVAPQGVFCSIKTPSEVRRGDKLYKLVDAE